MLAIFSFEWPLLRAAQSLLEVDLGFLEKGGVSGTAPPDGRQEQWRAPEASALRMRRLELAPRIFRALVGFRASAKKIGNIQLWEAIEKIECPAR